MYIPKDVLDGNISYSIPQETIDNEIKDLLKNLELVPDFNPHQPFDPKKHRIYRDDKFDDIKRFTLEELDIKKTHVEPISDIAVTNPFPLFTEEACSIMKWEAFQTECLTKYGRLPKFAKGNTRLDLQVCGYIDRAPFTKSALTHPETQRIINKIANVDLKIMFDYEICHINSSLIDGRYPVGAKLGEESDLSTVYDWHYDSNSVVLVLMLSTSDDMIGGKTGLKDGNENIVLINEPKIGYASLLQGRVIKHVATKPITNHERISAVVGYVPEAIDLPDTTVLTSFKASNLPRTIHDEYYPQWVDYRFKRIEQMLQYKRQNIMDNVGKQHFDQKDVIDFCHDIEQYLSKTYNEFELVDTNEYPPPIYSVPYKDL